MIVGACVLAAGESRRMGTPKALLLAEGRTYLEHLLAAFRLAGIAPRYVVARAVAASLQDACDTHAARLLVNPDPDRGMLSSLHVCLRAVQESAVGASRLDALFVAPVDCPRVLPATIARLAHEFEVSGAPIVVPRFAGKRGHPTLFSAALFEELLAAPLDLGARAVVWAHAADRLEVAVDDPAVLEDIDTPAAAARLEGDLPRPL